MFFCFAQMHQLSSCTICYFWTILMVGTKGQSHLLCPTMVRKLACLLFVNLLYPPVSAFDFACLRDHVAHPSLQSCSESP